MNEPIPCIESAYLNLGGARADVFMAEEEWKDGQWNESMAWIDEAIRNLESARAKIERHTQANNAMSHERSELAPCAG